MNLKHRGDIAMIKDCLLLDSEQAGYLGKLETGWAVTKLQGRWFKPFLVKFPLVTLDKGSATDETVRGRMSAREAEWQSLAKTQEGSSVVISRKEGPSGPARASEGFLRRVPAGDKGADNDRECAIGLTTKEWDFLKDVLENKTSSVTERYYRLHLSVRIGNNVQKSLLCKGLVASESVHLGKGRIKILCATKKGREVLGFKAEPSTRQGGSEHEYWKAKIAARLSELGYSVQEECPIGEGKTVDIVARRNDKAIAIEIETGKSDAAVNVRKCLEKGFERVFSVATTSRIRENLEREIQTLGFRGRSVKVMSATDLITSDEDILSQ